jgi:hypothetical protein
MWLRRHRRLVERHGHSPPPDCPAAGLSPPMLKIP